MSINSWIAALTSAFRSSRTKRQERSRGISSNESLEERLLLTINSLMTVPVEAAPGELFEGTVATFLGSEIDDTQGQGGDPGGPGGNGGIGGGLGGGGTPAKTEGDRVALATDYVAKIQWGDGLESIGLVERHDDFFTVLGQHIYQDIGGYETHVTVYEVDETDLPDSSEDGVANVGLGADMQQSTIRPFGLNLKATEALDFDSPVLTFFDTRGYDVNEDDFTVTIDWGTIPEGEIDSTTPGHAIRTGEFTFEVKPDEAVRFRNETSAKVSVSIASNLNTVEGSSSLIVQGAEILLNTPDISWSHSSLNLLGTFPDATPNGDVEFYTAYALWGDGDEAEVSVDWNSLQQVYEVWGSHLYLPGDYSLELKVFEIPDPLHPDQLESRASSSATVNVVDDSTGGPPPDETWRHTTCDGYEIEGDGHLIYDNVVIDVTAELTGTTLKSIANENPIRGHAFTATLGSTDAITGNEITAFVEWGDGTKSQIDVIQNGLQGSHTYESSGSFEVNVTILAVDDVVKCHETIPRGKLYTLVSGVIVEEQETNVTGISIDMARPETEDIKANSLFDVENASDIATGIIEWGDGQIDVFDFQPEGLTEFVIPQSVSHRYEGHGFYSPRLTVRQGQQVSVDVSDIEIQADSVDPKAPIVPVDAGFVVKARKSLADSNTTIATFETSNPVHIGGSHVVLVDWGDGSQSKATLEKESGDDGSGPVRFRVKADHKYVSPGAYGMRIYIKDQLSESVFFGTAIVEGIDYSIETVPVHVGSFSPQNMLVGRINIPNGFDEDLPTANFRAVVDWGNGLRVDGYVAGSGDQLFVFAKDAPAPLIWNEVISDAPGQYPENAGFVDGIDTSRYTPTIYLEDGVTVAEVRTEETEATVVEGTAGYLDHYFGGSFEITSTATYGAGQITTVYDPWGNVVYQRSSQSGGSTGGSFGGGGGFGGSGGSGSSGSSGGMDGGSSTNGGGLDDWDYSGGGSFVASGPGTTAADGEVWIDWGSGTRTERPSENVRLDQVSKVDESERIIHNLTGSHIFDASSFTDGDQLPTPVTLTRGVFGHESGREVQVADGVLFELQPRLLLPAVRNLELDTELARISSSASSSASFDVSIDWGDGQDATEGDVIPNSDGTMFVTGSYTYERAGRFDVTIIIESHGGTTQVIRTTSIVVDDIFGTEEDWAAAKDVSTGDAHVHTISAYEWEPPESLTSTAPNSDERLKAIEEFDLRSWYTAAIAWGDGQTSSAKIEIDPDSLDLLISGRHTYATAGIFPFRLQITDASGTPLVLEKDISVHDKWDIAGRRNTTGFDEASLESLGQASYSVNTGGIYVAHELDLDLSPGFGGQTLVYNSDTTDIQPVVEADVTLGDGLLATAESFVAEARLFWEGEVASDWVTFGADQFSQTLESIVVALAAQSTIDVVLSGIYDWELQVRVELDADNTGGDPWLYLADSGSTEVVVRNPEADEPEVPDEIGFYGAGWWLDFQDRLFITDNDLFVESDNDLVWATGTGGTRFLEIKEEDREPWEKQRLWNLDQKAYEARYDDNVQPPEIAKIRFDVPITTSGSSNDMGTLNLYLERPDGLSDPFPATDSEGDSAFDRPFFEFEDRHKTRLYFNEYGLLIGRVFTAGPPEYYEYDEKGRLKKLHAVDQSTSSVTYSGLYADKIKFPGNRTVTLNGTKTITSIDDVDGTSRSFQYDDTHKNHIDKITWGTLIQDIEFDDLKRVNKIKLGEGSDWEIATRESRILEDEKAFQVLPSAFDPNTTELIPHAAFAIVTDPTGSGTTATATDGTISAYLQSDVGQARYFGKPDGRSSSSAHRVWESIWSNIDEHGNTQRYEDPATVETYTYNYGPGGGQLATSTLVGVGTRTWEYHPELAYVTKFTNRNGNSTHSTYWSQSGRLKSTRSDEQTMGSQYAYNSDDLLQTLTDPRGYTTTYTYDANRRLASTVKNVSLGLNGPGQILPSSQTITTQLTYDNFGNPRMMMGPLAGEVAHTFFDARGRLKTAMDGEGKTFEVHHFFDHGPAEEFTQSGIKSKITIDSRGWQTRIEEGVGTPDARDFHTTFNLDGTVHTSTDVLDLVTTNEYDTLDRLIESDSNTGTVEHHYDPQGNLHYTKEALVSRPVRHRNYRYNLQSLLINEFIADQQLDPIAPDFVGPIQHQSIVSLLYNNEGGLVKQVDSRSHATVWTFDKAERIKTVTDRAGHVTTNFYDQSGNVTKVEGPEDSKTEWKYDEANRPFETIQHADQTAHVSRTFYNEASQVVASHTPRQWLFQDAFGDGSFSSFEYDTRGRITKQKDAEGREFTYEYEDASGEDNMNLVHKVTDYLGRVDQFKYDDLGRKQENTNSASELFKWEYDAAGRVTRQEVPIDASVGAGSHAVTTYDYDDSSLLMTATGPDDSTQITKSDGAGNTIEVTDGRGNTTAYDYDSYNRMHTMHLPATSTLAAATWQFQHDFNGNVTRAINPDQAVVDYEYDPMDRQNKVLLSVSQYDPASGDNTLTTIETATTFNGLGQIETVVTPIGTSTNTYDEMGRLRTSANAEQETTEWLYDLDSQVWKTIDAMQNERIYSFDFIGRQTSYQDPLQKVTNTKYLQDSATKFDIVQTTDPENNVQKSSHGPAISGTGTSSKTEYGINNSGAFNVKATTEGQRDSLGFASEFSSDQDHESGLETAHTTYNPTTRTKTITDAEGHKTVQTFDPNGNLVSIKDRNNLTTTYVYDERNQLIEKHQPDSVTTFFKYDQLGQVESITDAEDNTTSFEYDEIGRKTSETNQRGDERKLDYDSGGRLIRQTDRNERITTYTYDNVNRLLSESWLDASGTGTHTISFVWNDLGQMTSASDAFAIYDFDEYDDNGMLEGVDILITGLTPSIEMANGYDDAGQRERLLVHVNGLLHVTNDYEYDYLGRVEKIEQSGASLKDKEVNLYYQGTGALNYVQRFVDGGSAHTLETNYEYYDDGMLQEILHFGEDGLLDFTHYTYEYDDGNRITEWKASDAFDDLTNLKFGTIVGYDDLNQVTSADHLNSSDEDYSYDDTGNRNSHTISSNNRLESDGVYNYEHDDEGNRTKRTAISDGSYITYTWDHRNRLTDVDHFTASGTKTKSVDYTYDVFNRRVSKKVDDTADGTIDDGEFYVYDESPYSDLDDVLMTFDLSGNVKRTNLNGTDVDQLFASEDATGEVLWPLTDHQGTVREVVEMSDATDTPEIVETINYGAFGNIVGIEDDTGVSLTEPTLSATYTGREWDEDAQLFFYRARWYDAETGRFVSEDPTGFSGGDSNLSRYVSNATYNADDPSGLVLVAFDGTGNSPTRDHTNVWFLKRAYENAGGHAIYVKGVGTVSEKFDFIFGISAGDSSGPWGAASIDPRLVSKIADSLVGKVGKAVFETGDDIDSCDFDIEKGHVSLGGQVFGEGIQRRLNRAYEVLDRYLAEHPDDREIDIIGFSRGSATARAFANKIQPLIEKYEGANIRTIGVFDTVAMYGFNSSASIRNGKSTAGELNLSLPAGFTGKAFHAMAMDENRLQFPLSRFSRNNPHVEEVWFVGVHSDNGGGYPAGERGLSNCSFWWMARQLSASGVSLSYKESVVRDRMGSRFMKRHDELHESSFYSFKARSVERGDKVHASAAWARWAAGNKSMEEANPSINPILYPSFFHKTLGMPRLANGQPFGYAIDQHGYYSKTLPDVEVVDIEGWKALWAND